MSILTIVGFDTGNIIELSNSAAPSIQSAVTHVGTGYALRTQATGTNVSWGRIQKDFSTSFNVASAYHRFYFRVDTLPASGSEPIGFARSQAGTTKCELRINSASKLDLYDSSISLIASGTTALSVGTWYRIELRVGTGASASYELRINGPTEYSGTGNLTTSNNSSLDLGKTVNRNGNSIDYYFDDVAVSDSAFPGAGRQLILAPTGNGASTAGSAVGDVTLWGCVDEIPHDSDTTYVQTPAGTTNAGTYTLQSASAAGVAGVVAAVKSLIVAKRDGATNGGIRARLRSGSTTADGSVQATSSGYFQYNLTRDTDPATGAAWTLSALESVQAGWLEGSAAQKSRVTAVYLMVDFDPDATPPASGGTPVLASGILSSRIIQPVIVGARSL